MFGSSLAEIFSAPDYDCRLEGSHEKPEFAVTRLRSGPMPVEKAPAYPADDALLVCVSLTTLAAFIAADGGWYNPEVGACHFRLKTMH